MARAQNFWAALFLVLVASLGITSASHAYEPRVNDDFFGISAPDLYTLSGQSRDAELNSQLTAIKSAGLDWVRAEIGWADIEPGAPIAGTNNYDWTRGDRFVRSVAGKGLTVFPMLMGTPVWARSPTAIALGCGRNSGVSTLAASEYGAFARAVVQRYGTNGAFWAANPTVPYRPITRVELFNEPNWTGFWCGGVDPASYALAVNAAGAAIHAARPDTQVVAGGMVAVKPGDNAIAQGLGLDVNGFLDSMTLAAPGIAENVDAFAVHLYQPDPDVDIGLLGWFRNRLDAAGFGDSRILVNEFGWRTSGGPGAISEEVRASLYRELAGKYARTDCGVIGIAAHNWTSPEQDPNDPEHWFGIADPQTGALYPSGRAYTDQVALFEGRGPEPAPRQTINVCGSEPPDGDGDGVPDEEDDYPTDPDRDTGSGETPPAPPGPREPAYGPRVDPAFFGVAIADLPWEVAPRRAHLDSMAAGGIRQARTMVQWSHLEPTATGPTLWDETDTLTLQLANRGIGIAPYFGSPPEWAVSSPGWRGAYLDFLGDYARRYGPGGVFWRENGHLDPELAPEVFEVTPVGNSQTHWWHGANDPAVYADLVLDAEAAVSGATAGAHAIPSFFYEGDRGSAATYLRSMVEARPALEGTIHGVYVYSNAPTRAGLETTTHEVRSALDQTRNEAAVIQLGFGWPTRGPGAITEADRVELYSSVTSRLARGDCGVSRIYPHAWSTREVDESNQFEWYGMAAPDDGSLRATGRAYAAQISSFTGFGDSAPPRAIVHTCEKLDPDRDSDGVPDPEDDYPIDPDRHDGEAPIATAHLKVRRRGANATLTFSATDRSTLASFQCKLDREPWAGCGSPWLMRRLDPGRHTVRVAATDEWGNRDEVAKHWTTRGRKR